jgi:RNA polymerase-binding transcription factor DksA
MEREKLYLWAQRETKFLQYLDEALARIDAGTYGLCIECIDEPKNLCPTCPLIPKERLRAVPHTQLCVQVKEQQQKKK